MNNPSKALFSLLLLLTGVTFIVYRSDVSIFDTKKDVYVSAIASAAQVATAEMIDLYDVNMTYDGDLRESQDLPINLEALHTFRDTLTRLLESKKDGSLAGVSNINIPLTGFVTYEYIVGITYDDTYLLPAGYTYYMSDALVPNEVRGKVWNFTLGDIITIDGIEHRISGTYLIELGEERVATGVSYDIAGFLSKYGFKTLKEFASYMVMDCINEYLNSYSGASFNNIAVNTNTETRFDLGSSNFSSNREQYENNSGLIEGPGMFATVDIYTGSGDEMRLYQRITSFGGSELVER